MKSFLSIIVILWFLGACSAGPEPVNKPIVPVVVLVEDPPPPVRPETVPVPPVEDEVFDVGMITEEEFNFTKAEIQDLVKNLNDIIRAKNYNVWLDYLGVEYLAERSSPEYLARISEQPRLKSQNIVLTGPEDYFNHVVVPSRANDRVDDIEFIARNRVKAYTINAYGQRLRLYDLENRGNGWKIVN
jgi:hypothetical protein